MTASATPIDPKDRDLHRAFREEGFVILRGVVPRDRLAKLHDDLIAAYTSAKADGRLFSGGGTLSGHLNCFPGAESRFVFDTLVARGVVDLVRELSPQARRLPNVGCNLNLPGSNEQNRHIDGYAAEPFAIVNIAAVDTDIANGSMEVLPRTNRRAYKYWELVLEGPQAARPALSRGDVVIRTSMLWHRGMPNLSSQPRPMLALTWEDGGSNLPDPYAVQEGRIAFFPNRYTPTRLGRLKERAFIAAPGIPSAFRFVRSLFER
jgi:Phytanoyl-CoA dioxygenase (PhyH)